MLHKRSRLRAEEVAEVLSKGRSARLTYLQAKFLPGKAPLRCAAVAPKSLAKKATERNRLRRALYRALLSHKLDVPKGKVVFFVRAIPKSKLTPAFAEEVPQLLSKFN